MPLPNIFRKWTAYPSDSGPTSEFRNSVITNIYNICPKVLRPCLRCATEASISKFFNVLAKYQFTSNLPLAKMPLPKLAEVKSRIYLASLLIC